MAIAQPLLDQPLQGVSRKLAVACRVRRHAYQSDPLASP
jgi:hypothetical protein